MPHHERFTQFRISRQGNAYRLDGNTATREHPLLAGRTMQECIDRALMVGPDDADLFIGTEITTTIGRFRARLAAQAA